MLLYYFGFVLKRHIQEAHIMVQSIRWIKSCTYRIQEHQLMNRRRAAVSMTRWCQSGCSEYFWEFHQNILCNPHRSVEKNPNAPVGMCIVEREVRQVLLLWASYKPKPFSTWGRRATSAEDHGSREHTSEATDVPAQSRHHQFESIHRPALHVRVSVVQAMSLVV